MEVAELARIRGLGDAKAVRLKAALELGRRLAALSPDAGRRSGRRRTSPTCCRSRWRRWSTSSCGWCCSTRSTASWARARSTRGASTKSGSQLGTKESNGPARWHESGLRLCWMPPRSTRFADGDARADRVYSGSSRGLDAKGDHARHATLALDGTSAVRKWNADRPGQAVGNLRSRPRPRSGSARPTLRPIARHGRRQCARGSTAAAPASSSSTAPSRARRPRATSPPRASGTGPTATPSDGAAPPSQPTAAGATCHPPRQ